MDPQLRWLASRQADVVAAWQLVAAGWCAMRIRHRAKRGGWATLHRGVYVLSAGPLRREQLWFAAALSTPDSVLTHGSASARWGLPPVRPRLRGGHAAGTGRAQAARQFAGVQGHAARRRRDA